MGALKDPAKTIEDQKSTETISYRVYKRRWFMLFNFFAIFFINSAQWIQYTIIEDIVEKYYNISATMVNMTSVVYLITYLPLILPASYIMNKKGVRFALLLAAGGNFIGSWLKVFSSHPNGFYIGLIGQSILSVSQLFMLSMPPKLAGIWFDSNQMSTACTIGVFGTQLGAAAGFLVTPNVVNDHDNSDEIGQDLFMLFLIVAIITTLILILTFAFFQEEPPTPPSEAHKLKKQENEDNSNILQSYKRLLTNGPFLMLLSAYGLNIGIYNVINTLLNPILVPHFEDGAKFAGNIGLIIVASGSFSAVVFGIILDKTRRFKEVTIGIYVMSVIGMLAFTFAIASEMEILVYLSALILGFFVSGYIAVGFETGVELTYPETEFNSSGVLNSVSQTTGGIFTLLFTYILEITNDFWTNICMVVLLVIGTILTVLTKNVRRRQDALQQHKSITENKAEKY